MSTNATTPPAPAAPTPAPTPTPLPSLDSLKSSAVSLVVGLTWGAAMLVVFGFWQRSKYGSEANIKQAIFFIGGAIAFGLAAWQAFTLWFKQETPEQKRETLAGQRNLYSLILMVGGLGLIILAFVLGVAQTRGGGWTFRLDNFAECIGAMLFGLIALGSGYFLQVAPDAEDFNPVRFLVGKVPMLKLITVVLGVAALGSFIWLSFFRQIGFTWFPELSSLLFFSILCTACFLWLNSGEMDDDGVRLFVLFFGGVTGVILFYLSIGRMIVWRNDIFLGGLAAWQGEQAWRFWLCAYLLFASLIIMFLSFNLARSDIRREVNLRRLMYGYDAIAQGLLLVCILFVLNVVIYAIAPFTFDWTKTRGAYALSDSTKNIVSKLPKDLNLVVLIPQTHFVHKDLRVLLDNCQALSNKFKVSYVNPDTDQTQYERLAKVFPKILPETRSGATGQGVIIVQGEVPTDEKHTTPYAFVPVRKIFEFDRGMPQAGEKPKIVFNGESEIIKEVKFLLDDRTKRKIYVLQGDDEPGIDNRDGNSRMDFRYGYENVGIGMLVERLKLDNYDVAGLSFGKPGLAPKGSTLVYAKESADKRKEVPEDCQTLIVAGVSKRLPQETIEALERYMDRKPSEKVLPGKMMVFLSVQTNESYTKLKDTGLEDMLKRFGVEVTDEFALGVMQHQGDDPRLIGTMTPTTSENAIARQFPRKIFVLPGSARVVKPGVGGRYKAEPILQIEFRPPWATVVEKKVNVLKDPQRYMWLELQKDDMKLEKAVVIDPPVPVAVAVTDSAGNKPCMVVFGDTEFITNREVMTPGRSFRDTYSMVVSSLEWMAEREGIGALPKTSSTFQLGPEAMAIANRMILIPFWLMFLTVISLGVGVWVVRRR